MKVVFISNYINHHQKPFCDAMYKRLGNEFIFIQSEPMEEERVNMGWDDTLVKLPYVRLLYENEPECRQLIDSCDALIAGWTKRTNLIKDRLKKKKLTIRVFERIYREGQWKAISPKGLIAKYFEHIRFRKNPAYLLCCGAYVASDFSLIQAYPNKMYKFGYFPECKRYHLDKLFEMKDESGVIDIIFAGRFLKLKHPEYMVWLARDLQQENEYRASRGEPLLPDFRIHMVGSGELEHPMRAMVTEYGLLDKVLFYGFLKPEQVRALMERCHIHVFPSDALEGWGAVVNEAMNSACVVVASSEAGAVPFLIKQWSNGVAFQGGDYNSLKDAVVYLMTHAKEREEMATKAYKTITEEWNADSVSETLIYLIEGWMQGLDHPPMSGPLSRALAILPRNMYDYMNKNR